MALEPRCGHGHRWGVCPYCALEEALQDNGLLRDHVAELEAALLEVKERDALAAELERLRAMLRRWLEGSFAAPELEEQTRATLAQSTGADHE